MSHPHLRRARLLATTILVLLFFIGCASQKTPHSVGSKSGTNATPTRVISPDIGPDRRVTFRLRAPQASSVVLSGEFMTSSTNLSRDDHGVWRVTVGPIDPEIYNYNFTIDGIRTIDPGNPNVKTGSIATTISSILEVPGDGPAFYDDQPVPHGEVHTLWYQSKSLNQLRRVTVYTPPGYDRDVQTRLPVLYLLHGAQADETAWTKLGHANLILDNLLAAGKIKLFIVVMPFGYGVDPNAPDAKEKGTAPFSRDLLEDVIPYVESRYHTETNREARAIIGLSMGGGEALTIGLNHLELFSYVGGFSAAIGSSTNFVKTYAGLITNPEKANAQLKLLWLGCGKEDVSHLRDMRNLSEFLTRNNIRHTMRETDGAHTWIVWRRYLRDVSPELFKP